MTVDDTATSASFSESANPSKSSNESQGNLQHIPPPSMMLRWICTLLLRISIIFSEYLLAKYKTEALSIQKKNGVWYSELIRLPYFDIVRMSITDPMHTFLWGMAHNEIKLCLSSLPKDKKLQFQDHLQTCQSTI